MNACKIVGMGCRGSFETFYRALMKLRGDDAIEGIDLFQAENKGRCCSEIISFLSDSQVSSDLRAGINHPKEYVAGFYSNRGKNIMICLSSKHKEIKKRFLFEIKNGQ